MNMRIEPLSKSDSDFLCEMLYQALHVPPGHEPPPREIMRHPDLLKYYQNWGDKNDTGLIALDKESNIKVGAVWLRQFTAENKGYGYIDDHTPELSIALLPPYRGQGIGSILLRELLSAVKNKYGAISLSVTATNPAVRLYTRFGFKIVSEKNNTLTMKIDLNDNLNDQIT